MEVIINDERYTYRIEYHGGQLIFKATWTHPAEEVELEIDEVEFISGDHEAFKKLDDNDIYRELEEAI